MGTKLLLTHSFSLTLRNKEISLRISVKRQMLKKNILESEERIFGGFIEIVASSPSSVCAKVLTATAAPRTAPPAPGRTACQGPPCDSVDCVPGEASFEVKQKKAHVFSVVMTHREYQRRLQKQGYKRVKLRNSALPRRSGRRAPQGYLLSHTPPQQHPRPAGPPCSAPGSGALPATQSVKTFCPRRVYAKLRSTVESRTQRSEWTILLNYLH